MSNNINYHDLVARRWEDISIETYHKIYDAEFGRLLFKYKVNNCCALEIGSGRGELLSWLARKFRKVDGVEVDKKMYEVGLKRTLSFDNIKTYRMDTLDFLINLNRGMYDL